MRHIKRLAEVYDENVNSPYRSSQDYRGNGVNPYFNQTLNGLFLEFYGGSPRKVWTPWGSWPFAIAPSYETNLEGFMSQLTVREHFPERNTETGTVGPVYAILAIDGVDLPEPTLPSNIRQYLEYEVAGAEWERLFGES